MRFPHPTRGCSLARLVPIVTCAAALLVAVPGWSAVATADSLGVGRALAADVGSAINALRSSRGLGELSVSPELARAARQHAAAMGRGGFVGHNSPDGSSMTHRITAQYRVTGSSRWAVGEVLTWERGSLTAETAVAAWLGSSVHRGQMLDPRYRDVGVGAVTVEDAPGAFGGADVTIIVVDFGVRA